MRFRLAVAACCFLALPACSASRQARPDLPAPEYEKARALPAASAAPAATTPRADDAEGDQSVQEEKSGDGLGGGESAGKPKTELLEAPGKPDVDGSPKSSKPTTSKDTPAAHKRGEKPAPAASPEAPPSPTGMPGAAP